MNRFIRLFLGLIFIALSSGCTTVAFHEKGRLLDPVMAFSEWPTETPFYQKTYYSREGSVGGIGTSAGGGCGCF
ncbi:MAG: DUF4266 domain-containing protein [Verrucomicrobia bacterium]|nr:DUF4266 domain-containing protein [Verrucomicrobiota bacterium]MDA1087113.1 DUF4266 domain-containing protein [Verrucomicrobiota bacterium]